MKNPFNTRHLSLVPLAGSLLLAACAQLPRGPSVAVMAGPNKPFEVFAQDDQLCRDWAARAISDTLRDTPGGQIAGAAATGAVLGALVGAMVGDHRSAGVGAAMGTAIGASAGAAQGNQSAWGAQRRYDAAYQQCMVARGNGAAGPGSVPPPPPSR